MEPVVIEVFWKEFCPTRTPEMPASIHCSTGISRRPFKIRGGNGFDLFHLTFGRTPAMLSLIR